MKRIKLLWFSVLVFSLVTGFRVSNAFAQEKIAPGQDKAVIDLVVRFDLDKKGEFPFSVPAGKKWEVEKVEIYPEERKDAVVTLRNAAGEKMMELTGKGESYKKLPLWLPAGFSGSFQFGYEGEEAVKGKILVKEFVD
jgi:hypothetical protein